jgi:hypothetical protein
LLSKWHVMFLIIYWLPQLIISFSRDRRLNMLVGASPWSDVVYPFELPLLGRWSVLNEILSCTREKCSSHVDNLYYFSLELYQFCDCVPVPRGICWTVTDLDKHSLLVSLGSLFQKGLLLLANFIISTCLQLHLREPRFFLNGILDLWTIQV